jgi:hypothetical protein
LLSSYEERNYILPEPGRMKSPPKLHYCGPPTKNFIKMNRIDSKMTLKTNHVTFLLRFSFMHCVHRKHIKRLKIKGWRQFKNTLMLVQVFQIPHKKCLTNCGERNPEKIKTYWVAMENILHEMC